MKIKRIAFVIVCCGVLCACEVGSEQEKKSNVSVADEVSKEEIWIELSEKETEKQVYTLKGGKKLQNLVCVGQDNPYYCNRGENTTGDHGYNPVLVCKDPVYDITYFVNYGRDYLIYAEREGKTEVAVEIPASNLFCKDGELYFIAKNYGSFEFDGMKNGNILKYNPSDGSVKLLVSEAVEGMRVYSDAINFWLSIPHLDGGKRYYVKTYSFSTKFIEEANVDQIERWKEYGFLNNKLVNTNESSGEIRIDSSFLQNGELPYPFKIVGDCLYYMEWEHGENSELIYYKLESGEKGSVIKTEMPEGLYHEYIFFRDKIFFGNRMCYSLNKNELTIFYFTNEKMNYDIDFYYTDGEQLYGVVNGQLYRMEEVVLSEEEMQGRVSGTRYNGFFVASGTVDYELIDPTEKHFVEADK